MKKIVTVVLGLSLFVGISLFAKTDGMNCDTSHMTKKDNSFVGSGPSNFKYLYPDSLNSN